MIERIDSFVAYFEQIRRRTLSYCRAIPEDQIDRTPRPDELSFGDLIRHLAATEQMFIGVAVADRWVYPGHERQLGPTHADAMAYLEASHTSALAALGTLGDAGLALDRTALDGRKLPVWRILMLMVEHEIHHRSQIASYLAEFGLDRPQLYGVTVEQLIVYTGGQ